MSAIRVSKVYSSMPVIRVPWTVVCHQTAKSVTIRVAMAVGICALTKELVSSTWYI